MCGRFLLESEVEDLVARYNAEYSMEEYKTGEIFPSENALILIKSSDKNILQPMKWGFPMSGSKRPIINARTETIDKKPMFKSSMKSKRCIIPANAFFEWKNEGGKKIKHMIYKNSEKIFSMGGIYNNNFFVILTLDATEIMKPIHDRMPFILNKEEEAAWLGMDTNINMLMSLIKNKKELDLMIEPVDGRNLSFYDTINK